MYMATPPRPASSAGRTPIHALLLNAYYVDWLYDHAIVRPLHALSVFLARVVDLGIIDGLVNLTGRPSWLGATFRAADRLRGELRPHHARRAVLLVGYLLTR